jgi:hypothetical protein
MSQAAAIPACVVAAEEPKTGILNLSLNKSA